MPRYRTGTRCNNTADFRKRQFIAIGAVGEGTLCGCVRWPDEHGAIAGCDHTETYNDGASCAVVDGRALCVEQCWLADGGCSREDGFSCRELFAPDNALVYGCSPDAAEKSRITH